MFSWAGVFKVLSGLITAPITCLVLLLLGDLAVAMEGSVLDMESSKWSEFAREVKLQERRDARNGLSHIISGSLALAGGFVGSEITDDHLEKGIYTVFQTIGIASIGYGAYTWKIGGEARSLYEALEDTRLTSEQKMIFLRAYAAQKKERERMGRLIKAITHSLIFGLNIYNATQQKQESIRTGLYFVGGVNLLAAVSYTFEF